MQMASSLHTNLKDVQQMNQSTTIPKTQIYNSCDVINDLLDFAAEALRLSGLVIGIKTYFFFIVTVT